jgi:hypothetical protein
MSSNMIHIFSKCASAVLVFIIILYIYILFKPYCYKVNPIPDVSLHKASNVIL